MEPQPAPYDEGTDTTYNSVNSSNDFYPLDWYIPSDEQQLVEMYIPTEGWEPQLITAFEHEPIPNQPKPARVGNVFLLPT